MRITLTRAAASMGGRSIAEFETLDLAKRCGCSPRCF
jgi:hypothetical protein